MCDRISNRKETNNDVRGNNTESDNIESVLINFRLLNQLSR